MHRLLISIAFRFWYVEKLMVGKMKITKSANNIMHLHRRKHKIISSNHKKMNELWSLLSFSYNFILCIYVWIFFSFHHFFDCTSQFNRVVASTAEKKIWLNEKRVNIYNNTFRQYLWRLRQKHGSIWPLSRKKKHKARARQREKKKENFLMFRSMWSLCALEQRKTK